MKIAFITDTLAGGGANKVCANLENIFFKNGYETLTISLDNAENNIFPICGKVENVGLKTKKGFGIKKIFSLFLGIKKSKKILKNFAPEVIISHSFKSNFVNLILKKSLKSKIILVHHEDTFSLTKEQKGIGKIYFILLNKLVFFLRKKDDFLVCTSAKSLNNLKKYYKIGGNIKVIHNGIDLKKIEKLSEERIDEDLNFPYLISIGDLNENKNQILLIKAFEKIHDKIAENLVFVGTGPEKNNLKNYVKKAGLEDKIHFLGFKKNLYKYLKNSSIFISTSKSESFGLSLVEALSLGIPVISTKNSGSKEIIGNSNCGIILEYFDENELAEKIKFTLKNENYIVLKNGTKKYFNKQGIKRSKDFTIEKQFEEYEKLFN